MTNISVYPSVVNWKHCFDAIETNCKRCCDVGDGRGYTYGH